MQKLIVCHKYEVDAAINKLLSEGWSVVPETTTIVSIEQVRDRYAHASTTPQNTIFETMVSVVLEKGFKEIKRISGELFDFVEYERVL